MLGGAGGGEADAFTEDRGRGKGLRVGSGTLEETVPVERAGGGCGIWLGDEAAAPDLAGDVALSLEEFVGGGDGGAVQAKRTSQFAGGGEALAICQLSGLDKIIKMLKQLAIDRDR